ncbi:DUF7847 domain-containing protein [Candidatus Pyrohabitans sp.]
MGAMSTFPVAWRLVFTRQALLLPALLYALLSLPQLLLQLFYSGSSAGIVVASTIYSLLIWLISPFFIGGLLATAAEALRGEVTLSSFLRSAKKSYIYLLLANVIYMGAVIVGVVVLLFLGVILGISANALFSPNFALAFAVIFILMCALLLAVVLVMLNFYDVGIAIDGLDPIKTFKNSFSFVRSNPLSVLGFLALSSFTILLLYLPLISLFIYHMLSSLPTMSIAELEAGTFPQPGFGLGVVIIFLLIATNTLITCFMYTYRAVFYVDISREVSSDVQP